MRVAIVAAAWASKIGLTWAVAKWTDIGPVVLELSANHHARALECIVCFVAGLVASTITALCCEHWWATRS